MDRSKTPTPAAIERALLSKTPTPNAVQQQVLLEKVGLPTNAIPEEVSEELLDTNAYHNAHAVGRRSSVASQGSASKRFVAAGDPTLSAPTASLVRVPSGSISSSGSDGSAEPQPSRRGPSLDSIRSALSRARSTSRRSTGGSSVSVGGQAAAPRPGSVASFVCAASVDRDTVKEASKLSVKLWPKSAKTKASGKSNKERDFDKLVLAQELYLGWEPAPKGRRTSEAERRLSFASSADGVASPAASVILSPSSTHSGVDPIQSAGKLAAAAAAMNTSASIPSVNSASTSSSGPAPASLSTTSVPNLGNTNGHPPSHSRPASIAGGAPTMFANGSTAPTSTSKPRKSTWAMRFSVDGRYFAVAGQDAVVRVYEILNQPEQRQAEVDSALLGTGHGLGAGGSSMSLGTTLSESGGGSSPPESMSSSSGIAAVIAAKLGDGGASVASLASGKNNGRGSVKSNSSKSSRRSTKESATATNQAIPVFSSKPIHEYRGHTADIIDLSWSKNNFLMSASSDKTARLWHVTRSECLCTFGHMDLVTGACFHPTDDRFFLSSSLDGKLRLWNIPAKKVQYSQEVPGIITACAFTASGKMACAGTFGGAIVLYHTDKLTYATSIAVRSSSAKSSKGSKITGIEPLPYHGSGHEKILVSSNDSRVRIYDLGDKSVAHKFKASGYHNKASHIRASIPPDGTYIAAGSEDSSVYVWDATKGKAYGGLRGAGNMMSRSATKQFAEAAHEYWHTSGGTVTCAVVAPLMTHKLLDASEDPIMRRSWRHEVDGTSSSTGGGGGGSGVGGATRALSSLTLTSAISAAIPIAFRGEPGRPQVNARLNRIIVTADDTSTVQVWRADNLDLLGSIKQPMVVAALAGPAQNPSSAPPSEDGEM